jgi:beta-glucanase (GH16 family)
LRTRSTAARSTNVVGSRTTSRPRIVDEFSAEQVPIDVREFHVYAAEWTPEHVAFTIDGGLVKIVEQSPDYPMQLMLGIYEFPQHTASAETASAYPKEFVVDFVRGYRPSV